MVFRKKPAHSGRDRRPVRSSKKRSPPKVINTTETVLPLPKDSVALSKVLEDPQEELIKNTTNQQEEKSGYLVKVDDQCLSNNTNKIIVSTPPPIQGPITAYSKRMYKKLHGISPEKIKNENVSSESINSCDKNTKSPKSKVFNASLNVKTSENEVLDVKCSDDVKHNRVACKLQEEVNHDNKTPPTSTKSVPFGKPKQEHNTNNNEEKLIHSSPKSATSSNLIIKCDLREDKNSLNSSKSPNSISLNETIDSILKKHREANHIENVTPTKSTELKIKDENNKVTTISDTSTLLNRGQQDSKTFKTNDMHNIIKTESCLSPDIKLFQSSNSPQFKMEGSNKRLKPLISPATFGKLIPIQTNKPIANISPSQKQIKLFKNEASKPSRKRKLSSLFSPEKDTFKTQKTRVSSSKKNTYLELFGQSPIKPKIPCNNLENMSLERLRSPTVSPVKFISCSSPILPNSPSLDSDNPEDLVIDTTACSQNTSPRISESDQRHEEDIINKISPVAIKKTLQSLSEPHSDSKMDISIEPNNSEKSLPKCDDICKHNKEIEYNESTLVNEASKNNLNSTDNKILVLNEAQQISFTSTKLNNKTLCLPDLTECFSLDNDCQISNKIQTSDRETIPKDSKIITIKHPSDNNLLEVIPNKILLESNKSEAEPNKSSQICDNNLNDNKFEKPDPKVNNSEKISTAPRFIPSPPQLTLVSAFKHSENSVFNITEDTVGFVSALTRVRDISPIKTPDKSDNLPIISNHQSETNASTGNIEIYKTVDVLKTSCTSLKNVTQCSETIVSESECIKLPLTFEDGTIKEQFSESKSECNISNKNTVPTATKVKVTDHNNEFKRARPIRRLVTHTTATIELSQPNKDNISVTETELTSCDITTHVSVVESDTKRETCGGTEKTSLKSDRLLKMSKESECSNIDILVNNTIDSTTTKKELEIHKADNKTSHEINSSLCKLVLSLNSCPIEKTVFKRSESLKMMPKPIAKVNYDTLSKHDKVKEHCDNITISRSDKEMTLNKELVEIPHISRINKKVRVSKYQGSNEQLKHSITIKNVQNKLMPKETIGKAVTKDNEQSKQSLPLHSSKKEKTLKNTSLSHHSQKVLLTESKMRQPAKPDISLSDSTTLNISGEKVEYKRQLNKSEKSNNLSFNKKSELNNVQSSKNCTIRLQSKSPDHNSRSRSNYNQNKSQIERPSKMYQSNHKHQSKSPEPGNSRKNSHNSRKIYRNDLKVHKDDLKHDSKSLTKSQISRSYNYSRVRPEKSPSPERFSRNKSTSGKRRSVSRSPDVHDKITAYNDSKRSHREYHSSSLRSKCSPDRSGRSRSPHRRGRSQHRSSRYSRRTSRSISTSSSEQIRSRYRPPNPDDSCRQPRSRSHHYYRRSRSQSPCLSWKRIWRSCSHDSDDELLNKKETENKCYKAKVNDEEMTRQNEQSYNEELERLRKELQLVKSKLNKSNFKEEKDSQDVINSKLISESQPSTEKSNVKLSNLQAIQDCEKSILSDIKDKSNTKDRQIDNKAEITTRPEDKSVIHQNCSQVNKTSESSGICASSIAGKIEQTDVPFKIIKLTRRRTRNLGDSDVNVVSSSSKINNRTQTLPVKIKSDHLNNSSTPNSEQTIFLQEI